MERSSGDVNFVEPTLEDSFEEYINGIPVTSMVGTYGAYSLGKENVYIPSTVKYVFEPFDSADLEEDIEEIEIPKTVEYCSLIMHHAYSKGRLLIKYPSSLVNKDALTNGIYDKNKIMWTQY